MLRLRIFLSRFTLTTKILLILVVMDLSTPGWLVWGIPGVVTVNFAEIGKAIRGN
jgi:hypothetical protein